MKKLEKPGRIASVDMLRGVAALAVTLFHFTNGNENYLSSNSWLKQFGGLGWVGVEMFFVISGYIIPYSLYRSGYMIKNIKNFLIRRLTRIEPPYFVALVMVILLNFLSTMSPYYGGKPFQLDLFNFLLHIGYLNAFFGEEWLNPVFWTLAIEFQFYLLMAFFFPLLTYKKTWLNFSVILFFLTSYFFIPNKALIFHFSPYFVLGILIFYSKTRNWNSVIFRAFEISVLILIYLVMHKFAFFAAVISWAVLIFVKRYTNNFLLFIGTISYSIYLIHVPIGGRIINLSVNFVKSDITKSLVIFIALVVTVIASVFFYKVIEKPSLKLSHLWTSSSKANGDEVDHN